MKLRRILGVALLAGLSAGCSEPTLEELKADTELLNETLGMCQEEVAPEDEALCQRARRAAAEQFGSRVRDVMKGLVNGLRREE